MECFCEEGQTNQLTVEGDVSADPFWCSRCGCNLDVEDVPISKGLRESLEKWMLQYGEWIDWESDTLVKGGMALEDTHNQLGKQLTEKVKQELDPPYNVRFSPSSSAKRYAGWKVD